MAPASVRLLPGRPETAGWPPGPPHAVEAASTLSGQAGRRPARRNAASAREGPPRSVHSTSLTRTVRAAASPSARASVRRSWCRAPSRRRGPRRPSRGSCRGRGPPAGTRSPSSGTVSAMSARNALTQPTITKLFQRQPRAYKARATAADGFSQNQRMANAGSPSTGTGRPSGSIHRSPSPATRARHRGARRGPATPGRSRGRLPRRRRTTWPRAPRGPRERSPRARRRRPGSRSASADRRFPGPCRGCLAGPRDDRAAAPARAARSTVLAPGSRPPPGGLSAPPGRLDGA